MNKYIIEIINEEIGKYNYLGIDDINNNDTYVNTLSNTDFQKRFISDILTNNSNIKKHIQESILSGDYDTNDPTYISLTYDLNIEYLYDKNEKPIEFTLILSSDNIKIDVDTEKNRDYYGNTTITSKNFSYINWNDIDVNMYTLDGQLINFKSYDTAPNKIKELFIREIVEDFIENSSYNIN